MEKQIDVQEIIDNLPIVNPTRNYWLVRTSSGSNYEAFLRGNFVAIGWNEITLSDLNELHLAPEDQELKSRIRDKVATDSDEINSEEGRGIKAYKSKVVAQLMKFTYEIRRGDIIVIPSNNSDLLSFGEITSTPVILASDLEVAASDCSFRKRKSVNWIKQNVNRISLDSSLYRFIFAHQTINNVSSYSEYINGTLFDFYSMEGKSTLVLRLKKEQNLDAFRMSTLYSDLINFIAEFSEYEGQEIKEDSLSVKFDLQSPGTIVLSGILVVGLIALGLFTVFAGGDFGVNYDKETGKFNANFKSNSFLDKLSNFLDRKQDRKERAARLMMALKYFEIEQNKNLKSLAESEIEDPSNNTTDKMEN